MPLQLTEVSDSNGYTYYQGQFAGCDIGVKYGYDHNTETVITANGHLISTIESQRIVDNSLSLSEYVESILIEANVGR